LTLFFFLRGTDIWKLYLVNIYGLIFAVLIVLYLAGLFTWKSVFYFAGIMTALDIILVLVTGTMVQAAQTTQKLELPVMVSLPIFPVLMERYAGGFMSLGLGDFFFAGLLAVHTFKKYGKKLALVSIVAMTVSFFVFLTVLLSLDPMPFPGTLMIICGWAVIVLPIEIRRRKPPQPAQNTIANVPSC
jgi:MFS family permease